MTAFVTANEKTLRLYFLPPSSPKLNPDELLNYDVKSNALERRRPRTREAPTAGTHAHLRRRQKQPQIDSSLFYEEHVRYAAAK